MFETHEQMTARIRELEARAERAEAERKLIADELDRLSDAHDVDVLTHRAERAEAERDEAVELLRFFDDNCTRWHESVSFKDIRKHVDAARALMQQPAAAEPAGEGEEMAEMCSGSGVQIDAPHDGIDWRHCPVCRAYTRINHTGRLRKHSKPAGEGE